MSLHVELEAGSVRFAGPQTLPRPMNRLLPGADFGRSVYPASTITNKPAEFLGGVRFARHTVPISLGYSIRPNVYEGEILRSNLISSSNRQRIITFVNVASARKVNASFDLKETSTLECLAY